MKICTAWLLRVRSVSVIVVVVFFFVFFFCRDPLTVTQSRKGVSFPREEKQLGLRVLCKSLRVGISICQ